MTAPTEDRIDWEALLVTALLAVIALAGVAVFLRVLWEFRDAFWPIGILIGAAWFFIHNTAPRKKT